MVSSSHIDRSTLNSSSCTVSAMFDSGNAFVLSSPLSCATAKVSCPDTLSVDSSSDAVSLPAIVPSPSDVSSLISDDCSASDSDSLSSADSVISCSVSSSDHTAALSSYASFVSADTLEVSSAALLFTVSFSANSSPL